MLYVLRELLLLLLLFFVRFFCYDLCRWVGFLSAWKRAVKTKNKGKVWASWRKEFVSAVILASWSKITGFVLRAFFFFFSPLWAFCCGCVVRWGSFSVSRCAVSRAKTGLVGRGSFLSDDSLQGPF